MNQSAVLSQSKSAMKQWGSLWRDHARINKKYAPFKDLNDFTNRGVGRACLLIANGYSFEENIDTIREHQANVDILCCDKTLGHLLSNGITPTYCLVADAMVSYEKYLEPWKDQLKNTVLFMNVCGNPKWAALGNWKDRYFFVNQDVLGSEREFQELTGCPNKIPAATNVSNAMAVFLTQSDNTGRKNWFGYDKLLLIGFDYSWRFGGKYYAFDEDGGGKAQYMRHIYCVTRAGSFAYTSTNLHFSAQWLEKYISGFRLPFVMCSEETILQVKMKGSLADQMRYSFRPEDGDFVRTELARRDKLLKEAQDIERNVIKIGTEHYYQMVASV